MLREWKEPVRPGEEELKMRLAAAREKLAAQQLLIKEQKVPVLVLLEGWGTAGKGYCIGQIIENIDPRHFKVESMERKTGGGRAQAVLYRHFTRIPEAGKFVFLDSGWMDEVVEERLHGELSEEKYAKRIESVRRFERQLTDNGYLVMKFFLHISKKEQTRRMERLTDEKDTVWRVGKKGSVAEQSLREVHGCVFFLFEEHEYAVRTVVYCGCKVEESGRNCRCLRR